MSPSSSGSWGGRGARADIIDLDQYMRGNVRPSRTHSEDSQQCSEVLVVDGGGVGRKATDSHSSSAWQKRYSQDSGVSDGSYVQRRSHRPHRRASTSDKALRGVTSPPAERMRSDSLRAFRTDCEQALLNQQRQIERVAQICERLTERAGTERLAERAETERLTERAGTKRLTERARTERLTERARPERLTERAGVERAGTERAGAERAGTERAGTERVGTELAGAERLTEPARTERLTEQADTERPTEPERLAEDVKRRPAGRVRRERAQRGAQPPESSVSSSSSRSTQDARRKDSQRIQECKTYKIILSKLDDLNRRFSRARARPPPRSASSSLVTVSDKLVATDVERAGRLVLPTAKSTCPRELRVVPAPGACSVCPARTRVLALACSVRGARVQTAPHVLPISISKCESSCGSSAAGDPRCGFDLEDPVHLYSQAKRLRAPDVAARRAHSAECRPRAAPAPACGARGSARSPSLCSVCRDYWRSLRQCFVGPAGAGAS